MITIVGYPPLTLYRLTRLFAPEQYFTRPDSGRVYHLADTMQHGRSIAYPAHRPRQWGIRRSGDLDTRVCYLALGFGAQLRDSTVHHGRTGGRFPAFFTRNGTKKQEARLSNLPTVSREVIRST
ncbi:unnamed protein product, partial [Iphiclides podalirius]